MVMEDLRLGDPAPPRPRNTNAALSGIGSRWNFSEKKPNLIFLAPLCSPGLGWHRPLASIYPETHRRPSGGGVISAERALFERR